MIENLVKNSMTYKELKTFSNSRSKKKDDENKLGKLISECDKFELDLQNATIKWALNSDTCIQCLCQIVGTRTGDGQFMWAWGHPSVPEKSSKAAKKVQIFGNKHNFVQLMGRKSIVSDNEANTFSDITSLLNDADGTWAGSYGDGMVYLIYYKNQKELEV